MHAELAYLRERIARLEELVERKISREPLGGPATRIVPVKLSSGTTYKLQDFDGSNYIDAPLAAGVPTSEREITVQSPSVARAIWSVVSNRYELLSGDAWLGVLTAGLSYHGSASVALYSFDSGLGYFTDSGQTDTCYGWLLLPGDTIPTNTQVIGCVVNGKRVAFDAACTTGT